MLRDLARWMRKLRKKDPYWQSPGCPTSMQVRIRKGPSRCSNSSRSDTTHSNHRGFGYRLVEMDELCHCLCDRSRGWQRSCPLFLARNHPSTVRGTSPRLSSLSQRWDQIAPGVPRVRSHPRERKLPKWDMVSNARDCASRWSIQLQTRNLARQD